MNTIFTGFKTYKAPTFTVTCPQSGYQFDVRGLSVGEITRMKESLITQNRLSETTLDIMWEAIDKDTLPSHINSKDLFAENLTTNDRQAVVYGIYYMTYGSDREYELSCGDCNQKSLAKIDYSEFVNIVQYPYSENVLESYKVARLEDHEEKDEQMESILEDTNQKAILMSFTGLVPAEGQPEGLARQESGLQEFFAFFDANSEIINLSYDEAVKKISEIKKNKEINDRVNTVKTSTIDVDSNENDIFNRRVEIKLKKTGVVALIKAPTVKEEIELLKKLTLSNDMQIALATDTLFIDRFEEFEEGKTIPIQSIVNKTDILTAYRMLPYEDKEQIIEKYEEEFGKYGLEVNVKWKCMNKLCERMNEMEVDMVSQFFRTTLNTR